jgi:hypothetical protein
LTPEKREKRQWDREKEQKKSSAKRKETEKDERGPNRAGLKLCEASAGL